MSDATTFKEAYATLQRHAQTLRSQQEPDIDNLTTIVSESVAAYKVCKQRIDAVEKALEASLGDAQLRGDGGAGASAGTGTGTGTGTTDPNATSASTDGSAEDDDIPF